MSPKPEKTIFNYGITAPFIRAKLLRMNIFYDFSKLYRFYRVRSFTVAMLLICTVYARAQEEQEKDSTVSELVSLDEVLVSAVRVTSQNPVTFSNLSKTENCSAQPRTGYSGTDELSALGSHYYRCRCRSGLYRNPGTG